MTTSQIDLTLDEPESPGIVDGHVVATSDPARRMIDAAVAVIDRSGEGAVRVQDIVATVGVQMPALYRHFGSREGLVQAAQVARLERDLDSELERIERFLQGVESAAQFRALFDAILAAVASPERRTMRATRINVLGSVYGRPTMGAEVAAVQRHAFDKMVGLLRGPQAQGWLREGLDLEAFVAWFAGQVLGRILIEVGPTGVDDGAWNAMSADAVRHVLFG